MKKKLLSVLMAAVMVAGVGGVGAAQVKADDEKILGAGIYSASDNFNSYIGKAITNACDGIFKTNIEDGQNDQSTQNNQVDTMLAKGASAVAVSVCDVTAAPTLIQKCKDAGNVPIIFFNKEITDYDVINSYENAYQVTSTGGDYGASIQAQMVIDYWKEHPEMDKNGDGKLQLVYLMGDPGHTASQPRCDYLKSTIEDAGIEIDLLAEDTGMWVTATAKEKMDAWVSKYGDEIECCVAGNDAMALAPMLMMVSDEGKKNIESYAQAGGKILFSFRSGIKDMYNNMLTETVPGVFADLAGVEVEDYDPLLEKTTAASGVFGNGTAHMWCDIVKPVTAKILGRYTSDFYAGEACMTVNQTGKGEVYYLGCDLDEKAMKMLAVYLGRKAGIDMDLYKVDGVEVVDATDGTNDALFILNYNDHSVIVSMEQSYENMITHETVENVVELKPYDVAILKEAN